MDDQRKLAFEFARDSSKQIITLSTGIIALTITFSKDFIASVDNTARTIALLAWFAFLFSVFAGVWTLLALTGTLEALDDSGLVSIRGRNVTLPSMMQIVSFLLGLLLTVLFGVLAVT